MIDQAPTVPLLIVLTFRPEFALPWPARSHVRPLTLSRLERPQIEVMATRLAGGKELPAEVFEHVVQKTDGVPLFVEEMTKAVLGSSVLRADGDRYMLTGPLSEISIPASLHESLMARLDRLPTVREVAQLGAVLGREMLRAIATIDEPRLRDGLGRLVEAELLYQRGRPPRSRYIFKHALIQDAAYQSLLRRTRQQYHRQVAELLESDFADTVEANPELVAHHYSEAGLPTPAVIYWQRAGEKAARRSANQEAIGHPNGRPLTIGSAPRDARAGEAGTRAAAAARPGEPCHERRCLARSDPRESQAALMPGTRYASAPLASDPIVDSVPPPTADANRVVAGGANDPDAAMGPEKHAGIGAGTGSAGSSLMKF